MICPSRLLGRWILGQSYNLTWEDSGSPLLDDGGGQVMKAKLFRETCLSQGVSVLHR